MDVKICCDGSYTHVYEACSNEEVAGLSEIRFEHKAGVPPSLLLISKAEPVLIHGTASFMMIDPAKGGKLKAVRRIEFEDGSVFEPK